MIGLYYSHILQNRLHAVTNSPRTYLHRLPAHVTLGPADHSILRSPEQVPMGEKEPVLPDVVPFPHAHLPAPIPTLPLPGLASFQSFLGSLHLGRWLSTWFILTSSDGDLDQLHLITSVI